MVQYTIRRCPDCNGVWNGGGQCRLCMGTGQVAIAPWMPFDNRGVSINTGEFAERMRAFITRKDGA